MNNDFHDAEKRKALVAALAKNQALAEHFILESASNRWHVAVTVLRKELSERRPGRAFGRFLAAISGGTSAVSDFIEDLRIAPGGDHDAVVSWAKSPKALIEEVKIIRACLDHAGWFDATATSSLKIKASLEAGPFNVQVNGENNTVRTQARFGLAGLFKKFSIPLDANLDMEWVKSIEHKDSRAKLLAAILSVESQSGDANVTCENINKIRALLKQDGPGPQYVEEARKTVIPRMAGYLKGVMDSIEPDIRRVTEVRGDSGKWYYSLFKGITDEINAGNYEKSLLIVEMLGHAPLPLADSLDPMLDLIAATAILLIQVHDLEKLSGGPNPTQKKVVPIKSGGRRRGAGR